MPYNIFFFKNTSIRNYFFKLQAKRCDEETRLQKFASYFEAPKEKNWACKTYLATLIFGLIQTVNGKCFSGQTELKIATVTTNWIQNMPFYLKSQNIFSSKNTFLKVKKK